jgi:hypothetical protein
MARKRVGRKSGTVLSVMTALFIGHTFMLGGSPSFALGLPQWYWTVAGVSVLLYAGTVVLIDDFAVGEARTEANDR